MYYTIYNSIVGRLYLVSKDNKLVGVYIENQKYFLRNIKDITLNNNLEIFIKTKEWLDRYFRGDKPDIDELPLELNGTEFQKLVWEILKTIPYGKVITYGEIAKKVGKIVGKEKMSSQAIGSAISKNPISIIIPCHRIVGSNGNLVGYAGGILTKEKLLTLKSKKVNKNKLSKNVK